MLKILALINLLEDAKTKFEFCKPDVNYPARSISKLRKISLIYKSFFRSDVHQKLRLYKFYNLV